MTVTNTQKEIIMYKLIVIILVLLVAFGIFGQVRVMGHDFGFSPVGAMGEGYTPEESTSIEYWEGFGDGYCMNPVTPLSMPNPNPLPCGTGNSADTKERGKDKQNRQDEPSESPVSPVAPNTDNNVPVEPSSPVVDTPEDKPSEDKPSDDKSNNGNHYGNDKPDNNDKDYVEQELANGNRPTIREIMDAVDLKSTSTVAYHLKKLGLSDRCDMITESRGKRKIIELLGSKCVRCGFSDIRALQIDHINGGGTKERKLLGTSGVYRKILQEIESGNCQDYQILCANCNWIKVYENQESDPMT